MVLPEAELQAHVRSISDIPQEVMTVTSRPSAAARSVIKGDARSQDESEVDQSGDEGRLSHLHRDADDALADGDAVGDACTHDDDFLRQ